MAKKDLFKELEERRRMFETMKHLDSQTLVEIPQSDLRVDEYRFFLSKLAYSWIAHKGNKGGVDICWTNQKDDQEGGFSGIFGGDYIDHCKLYFQDGTFWSASPNDMRTRRGLMIRDHYSEEDVVKVQKVTDNLVNFLNKNGINHLRYDFTRDKLPILYL